MLSDARGEVQRGLEVIEYACGIPTLLKGDFSEQASTGIDVYSIRQPLGVVAGITPFNFPAMVPMWMWAPAIACGNTFVLKPSEKDPSASVYVAELLKEAGLPDGVFNVVHGDKVAVDAILEHPDIAAVSFVGSTPIARLHLHDRHREREARPGARRREEPHGRPPGRRHRDGRRRSGQRGLRLGGRALHGDLRSRRRRRRCRPARRGDQGSACPKVKVGPGTDPDSEMGPLVTREHRDKVASYIDQGREQGATVVADGRETAPDGDGFFLGVSLLDNVTPEMDAYKDEIFGPVLSVVRAETYDDAVRMVNENPYGNGVAIFTRDGGAARQFQFDVQVGMVGDQRADPCARGVLLVRRLEGVALRRLAHLRAGGDQLLHARQGRHRALARPGDEPGRPRLPADALRRFYVRSAVGTRHSLANREKGLITR